MISIKRRLKAVPQGLSKLGTKIRTFKGGLTITSLVLILLLPLIFTGLWDEPVKAEYWLNFFTSAMILIIVAASWDLLAGYTGLFSFGHSIFYGIGGYMLAYYIFEHDVDPYASILIGGLFAALFGFLLGYMCLRLKGPYLALTLLAVSIAILLLTQEPKLEHIYYGQLGIGPLQDPIDDKTIWYYFSLIIMVGSVIVMKVIGESKFGTVLKAIRDDDVGAEASGINLTKYKVIVFIVSAFFTGIAGALYTLKLGAANNQMFAISVSFMPIMMAAIGGLCTVTGAALGAFIYTIIKCVLDYMAEYAPENDIILYNFLTYGDILIFSVVLILIVRFAPNGLLNPAVERLRSTWELVKGN